MTPITAPPTFDPVPRERLLASLCCTETGLHILANLYKNLSISDSPPDVLANGTTMRNPGARGRSQQINKDCRSLEALFFRTHSDQASRWEKFIELRTQLRILPLKDIVLVAMAKLVEAATAPSILVTDMGAARDAVETQADEKETRILLAPYATSDTAYGNPNGVITNRLIHGVYMDELEAERERIIGRPIDENIRFWIEWKENNGRAPASTTTKFATDTSFESRPIVAFLQASGAYEKLQAVILPFIDMAIDSFGGNATPDTITVGEILTFLATTMGKKTREITKPFAKTLSGTIANSKGNLSEIPLRLAEAVGRTPEEAYPENSFKPSPSSRELTAKMVRARASEDSAFSIELW